MGRGVANARGLITASGQSHLVVADAEGWLPVTRRPPPRLALAACYTSRGTVAPSRVQV